MYQPKEQEMTYNPTFQDKVSQMPGWDEQTNAPVTPGLDRCGSNQEVPLEQRIASKGMEEQLRLLMDPYCLEAPPLLVAVGKSLVKK
jgi:hypothetical protein